MTGSPLDGNSRDHDEPKLNEIRQSTPGLGAPEATYPARSHAVAECTSVLSLSGSFRVLLVDPHRTDDQPCHLVLLARSMTLSALPRALEHAPALLAVSVLLSTPHHSAESRLLLLLSSCAWELTHPLKLSSSQNCSIFVSC